MLTHEFWQLAETGGDYAEWNQRVGRAADVVIHDALVQYMSDTLCWIPTINPVNPGSWSGFGLNYYGRTIINSAGAPALARILRCWVDLFREGPDELELRGAFQSIEGEPAESGNYERVRFNRDDLVRDLSALADLAEQVAGRRVFLLHWGI